MYVLFAPRGLAPKAVGSNAKAIKQVLNTAAVQQPRLNKDGIEPIIGPPELAAEVFKTRIAQ